MAREFILLSDGSIGRVSWTEGYGDGAIYVGRKWHATVTNKERDAARVAACGRAGDPTMKWYFAFEHDDDYDDDDTRPVDDGDDGYG